MTLSLISSVLCIVQAVVVGVSGNVGDLFVYALAAIFLFVCFLLAYTLMKLKEKYERTEKELKELREKLDGGQKEEKQSRDDSAS